MADLAQIEKALRKADALARQGDAQAAKDAKRLADAYRAAKGAPSDGVPEGMTFDPISGQYRDREMRARARTDAQGTLAGVGRSIQQGAGFALGDEANAALAAAGDRTDWQGNPLSFGDAYASRLEDERAILDQFRTDRPVAAYGSEIGGALTMPGRGLPVLIAEGMAYGFGAGEGGPEERAQSAAIGGGLAGTAGLAGQYALKGVQKIADNRATRKAVREAAGAVDPSMVRAEGRAAFKGLEARGVSFNDEATARLLSELGEGLQDFKRTAPKAIRLVGDLAEDAADGGMTFKNIMDAKSRLGTLTIGPTTPESAAAAKALSKIDSFVDGVLDTDAVGDVAGLSADWKEARRLWRAFKNSDRLQAAIDKAPDYAGGEEKGIKAGFRAILRDKKARAALSKEEVMVIREVLKGSRIGNLLRDRAGLVSGYIAGSAFGGPVGGLVGAAAGSGLKAAGNAMNTAATREAAERAVGFVAGGGRFVRPEPLMLPQNALDALAYPSGAAGVNLWNR